MNEEQLRDKFEQNVAWLQRNIAPDDIYLFTEQTFMAALYFLHRWNKSEDVNQIVKMDPIAAKWVKNVTTILRCREMGMETKIDLGMETTE